MRDTVKRRPTDLGQLFLCESLYDHGPDPVEYEEELFFTGGEIVTPLDLDQELGSTNAENHLKFLCNKAHFHALERNPAFSPSERPTTRDGIVALTMQAHLCPFIVSESPSDYNGIVTLLLLQREANLFWNQNNDGYDDLDEIKTMAANSSRKNGQLSSLPGGSR